MVNGLKPGIDMGDRVTFRLTSPLPAAYKIPLDAVGTVVRRYVERDTKTVWLDISFGERGFVFAASPDEFNLAGPQTS